MAWALVTPASRGIGFALTRHLLKNTNIPVVATARTDLESVKESLLDGLSGVEESRLHVLKLDVTDEPSIAAAATTAKSLFQDTPNPHLRLAFSIPGILHPEKSPSQISYTSSLETFKINTLGPLMLLKHFSGFLPLKKSPQPMSDEGSDIEKGLTKSAIWVTMAARVGSTSDNKLGGWYSYRASKAGVYSLTKSFDIWLSARCGGRAMAVCYHPGTVRTGLSEEFWKGAVRRAGMQEEKAGEGRGHGLFEKEEAVEKLWGVVKGLGLGDRGKCYDWRGEEILP